MGQIKKIIGTQLVGGTDSSDLYPITSTKAVYHTNNKSIDGYIDHLKSTATFAGEATPSTIPDTPTCPVFYIATQKGTYTNFNNIEVGDETAIIMYTEIGWVKLMSILNTGGIGGNGGPSLLSGIINITSTDAIVLALKGIASTNDMNYYIIGDNLGALPSVFKAVSITPELHKQLVCSSPNSSINAILRQINSSNFKAFGVNVGDILILTRVNVKIEDLCTALNIDDSIKALLLVFGDEIEMYQYKILVVNDAKPTGHSEAPEGTNGIVTPWDKTLINKIPIIDSSLLRSSGISNMDLALENGVYPWCTSGRPSGAIGAFTCFTRKSMDKDSGGFYSIEQTAYGRQDELGRIFKRTIFKSDAETQYGDWIEITGGSGGSSEITSGSITSDKIANLAVTSTKIADNAVTTSKIANFAVTTEKINNSAITTEKIVNGSVTTSKLADNSVTNDKIGDLAIDNDLLAEASVTGNKIVDGTIPMSKLDAALLTLLSLIDDSSIKDLDISAFLSSVDDDTAHGIITFLKGIVANETSTFNTLNANNINVSEMIKTKNLEVTGLAHFFLLVIDLIKSVGGRIILSLANCEAAYVLTISGAYRVYFLANDGDKEVTNNFEIGDLAICQTFNAGAGTYLNVSNRYYWRKVINRSSVSSTLVWDASGKKYHFIDLSSSSSYSDPSSTLIPAKGDCIVLLGNTSDKTRSNAIILSAYNDSWLDTEIVAPSIALYSGIGINTSSTTFNWKLAPYRITYFAANGNKVIGDFEVNTLSGTASLGDYIDGKISGSSFATTATEISGKVESIESNINTLNDNINNIPLKTNELLNQYTSLINQTSKEILLEVAENINIRKNLLPDTHYWVTYEDARYSYNGDNSLQINKVISNRTSDRINGHNSLQVSYTQTSSSSNYPGIYFKAIPVISNKTYCISTWVKKVSNTANASIICHYFSEANGSMKSLVRKTLVDSTFTKGEWKLVQFPITIPSEINFVNIIFCLDGGTTGTFRLCETMMEEGSERTFWTPSELDYTFINGNLISNSDTLDKVIGNNEEGIIATGTSVSSGNTGNTKIKASKATVTATYSSSSRSWTLGYATLLGFRYSSLSNIDYIFSFYAKCDSGYTDNAYISINFGGVDSSNYADIVYAELSDGTTTVYSSEGGNANHSGYFVIRNIPKNWTRYWVHFKANSDSYITPYLTLYKTLGELNSGVAVNNSVTVSIMKPKLETGGIDTEWTSSLDYYLETSSVANNLKRTGIDITNGTITLSADNTIIDGDLYLKGVLVENYAEKNSGEFVICDLKLNKSVSVTRSLVVLPMIDDITITLLNTTTNTINSFLVKGVKESGIKLTIAAKYENLVAKWNMATPALYDNKPSAMVDFNQYATLVFADPRLVSRSNYTSTGTPTILPEGGGGSKVTNYEGGVFICNGRRGRILMLMPGQTLHLTSAIENINGTNHLIWYIDNGSEFKPISKPVLIYAENSYSPYEHNFTYRGGSSWPNEVEGSSGSEHEDSLFAPELLGTDFAGSSHSDNLEIELYSYEINNYKK